MKFRKSLSDYRLEGDHPARVRDSMLVSRRDFLAAGACSLASFHRPARATVAVGPHQHLTAIHVMIEEPAWAADQDPWLKRLVTRCVTHYSSGLAIEMQGPTGIQVVFGRKAEVSVVSLVNLYGGLAPGTDSRSLPQVGPVRVTVRMGSRPMSVRLVGGSGLDWKYREGAIDANIQSIGHHALLILTQRKE